MPDNGPETIPYRVRSLEREIENLKRVAAEAAIHRIRLTEAIKETRGVKRALWGLIFAVVLVGISNYFK